MHASFYLRNAFKLPLIKPVHYIGEFLACAICGKSIDEGYPMKDIVSDASAELADTFRYSAWLCEDCALCFGENRLLTSNIMTVDEIAYKPMIAQSSATEDRPSWRDLIKQIPHGAKTVAIVTGNTKQRLWLNAPVSQWGASWRPFFSDGNVKRILSINVAQIPECLSLIEDIYNLGFSKQSIEQGLLHPSQMKALEQFGYDYLSACDSALAPWRPTDIFRFCLFIAQKEEK